MSPRTFASGDKALQILAQMKRGKSITFRTSNTFGNVTSEPISFPLDGFTAAATKCGL